MTSLYKLWMIFCHKVIMFPFLKVIIGGEFFTSSDLKTNKPYIIVANHHSHVDTLAILSALPLSQVGKTKPVAAKDYFARGFVVKTLSLLFVNPLFIDRKNKDSKDETISSMVETLKAGNNLILFPEGSRVPGHEVQKFKKGVLSVLRALPHVGFIPVYIDSSAHVLPKGDAMVVPHNFKVQFGALSFIDLDKTDDDNIDFMRSQVLALQNKGPLSSVL